MQKSCSIKAVLLEGTRMLHEAGIPNPRRESIAIWAAMTGLNAGDVWLRRDCEALDADSRRYREALLRRSHGEPLPYVVGETGFRKLDLKVDGRALIPRPETEGLVDWVLDWGQRRTGAGADDWGVAVDVGTGTGCIALSIATEGRFTRVFATDISTSALELAASNVEAVSPVTPVELRKGFLLEPLGDMIVDVVVSNPPYISAPEYATMDRGVTEFEPRDALLSGTDGMHHTRVVLESAIHRLAEGGLIALEVDSTRAGAVVDYAKRLGWSEVRLEDDLFERPRFFLATKET